MSLYGGAITSTIPPHFLDASTLREIPDNQEVFVGDGSVDNVEQSLVFDLMEELAQAKSLEDAAQSHLHEITALNGAETCHVLIPAQPLANKFNTGELSSTILVGAEPAHKWGRASNNNVLIIALALVRISKVKADLVVSYNMPISDGEQIKELEAYISSSGSSQLGPKLKQSIEKARDACSSAAESVKINDWKLFG